MNNTPTPIDDHDAYSKWLHKHMTKKGRATGQIDSLMESGTGLLLFQVWEAAKDECRRELTAVTEQRDRLAEALQSVKCELGVPQPEYPSPVANAYWIADKALQSINQNSQADRPNGSV